MAKESPADKVKRELAEKEAAAKVNVVDPEDGTTNVVDTKGALTDEEVQNIEAGFEGDQPTSENATAPAEDPELAKARAEKFARADEFERQRAAKLAGSNKPAQEALAEREPNVQPIDDEWVAVRMPRASFDDLFAFAASLPRDTPRSHSMCGYGNRKLTVGTIKDAAGLPPERR